MSNIDSVGGNSDAAPSTPKEAIPTIGASVPRELAEKVANALSDAAEIIFSPQELHLVHADHALQKAIFDRAKSV